MPIPRNDLIQAVKMMVREKGGKWSTAHNCAINDVLDVIDDDFLCGVEQRLADWEKALAVRENVLVRREEDAKRVLSMKADVEEIDDPRGKTAYKFASKMYDLFREMKDQECREYVSYAVYAYLTGDKERSPIKED